MGYRGSVGEGAGEASMWEEGGTDLVAGVAAPRRLPVAPLDLLDQPRPLRHKTKSIEERRQQLPVSQCSRGG